MLCPRDSKSFALDYIWPVESKNVGLQILPDLLGLPNFGPFAYDSRWPYLGSSVNKMIKTPSALCLSVITFHLQKQKHFNWSPALKGIWSHMALCFMVLCWAAAAAKENSLQAVFSLMYKDSSFSLLLTCVCAVQKKRYPPWVLCWPQGPPVRGPMILRLSYSNSTGPI